MPSIRSLRSPPSAVRRSCNPATGICSWVSCARRSKGTATAWARSSGRPSPEPNSAGSRKRIGSLWIFPPQCSRCASGPASSTSWSGWSPKAGGPMQSDAPEEKYEVNVSEGQRTRWLPSELRQDRVRHGLEGVYVVHLQPLQHYSLHTGFGEMSEPLDDLARRPGEDGGGKVILQLVFELAVYVGLCATEDDARHQGSAYLFGHPPCLAHQVVEPGVEIHEGLRLQEDGVPLVRVAGRQRQRPPHAVTPDDHRRPSWTRRARQEQGVIQPVELAVEGHRLIVAEQPGHDLEPLLEAGEAPVCVEQVEAEGLMLPFVPARAKSEPEASAGQVVHGGGLPGGNDGMPERDGRDQGTELYAAGILRKARRARTTTPAHPCTYPSVCWVCGLSETVQRSQGSRPPASAFASCPSQHPPAPRP